MSFVATACAPHNSATRRAVRIDGVSTSIGVSGRSRATRRAVEPLEVNTVIALIGTVSAMVMQLCANASDVVASNPGQGSKAASLVDRNQLSRELFKVLL